jgi:hypothetical protein
MTTAKSFLPKFNADRFIKSTIANTMVHDAHDFIWRVGCIKKHMEYSGYSFFSKIYVDLLMAIESDLKCLIIALSKNDEKPEDAYKVARSKSHHINKLYKEVEIRAKNRLKLLDLKDRNEIIEKSTQIKVSNRYHLFSLLQIRDEDPMDRDFGYGKYSSLLSFEYISELERIAIDLHKITLVAMSRFTVTVSMSGQNMNKYSDRLKRFKSELGNKL